MDIKRKNIPITINKVFYVVLFNKCRDELFGHEVAGSRLSEVRSGNLVPKSVPKSVLKDVTGDWQIENRNISSFYHMLC